MDIKDVLFLIGGGSAATILSVVLQHFQKNYETKMKWYDRAVLQVTELNETIKELKELLEAEQEKNKEITRENIELQRAIMKMEIAIDRLKYEIQQYEKNNPHLRKGAKKNE